MRSDWTTATGFHVPRAAHDAREHKPTGALLLLFWRVDHRGQLWWWELHLNRGDGRHLCTRIVEGRRRQPPPFKAAEAAMSAAPK